MTADWSTSRLGDFLQLQRGFDLPKQDRIEGPVPIVSSSGISGYHAEAKVTAPGVVTGRYGTLGEVFLLAEPFWPLNTTLYVRDFKGNEPKFLFYLLKSLDLAGFNDKSSVPGINRNHVHELVVSIPPLREQQAIAAVLGALDDKIELNRRMNRTLEELARANFRSWFVDFDPVRAKAAGRAPVGMDAETAALFPAGLVESEVGLVPEGWGVGTIGQEVDVVGGSTPSTSNSDYWSGGTFPFATPKDLSDLQAPVLLDTDRHITEVGVKTISSGQVPAGTVLLSSRAPIGYLAIAGVPLSINQGFIAMICRKQLPNHYVRLWADHNLDGIKSRANGTTFLEVSKSNFRPMPVLVPDRTVLDSFCSTVEPMFERVVGNRRESATLAATRDYLLPKLLSGEVRVQGLEGLPRF